MSSDLRLTTLGVWALALGLLGGCQSEGVIFEPLASPLRWPPPPAEPRIEYVGALATSADLKPATNFFQGVGEALFGKESTRSLLTPLAVTTDGGSRVFICDSNAQVVHVFDLDSREYAQWRPPRRDDEDPATAPDSGFSQPVGVAYDALGGRLLVSDAVEGVIHVFDADGTYLGTFGEEVLGRPTGLAVDPRLARIYVADPGRHQIMVLGVDGELVEALGARGSGPGFFNYPTNVALDDQGNVYVSDSLNFRIQVFNSNLQFLRQFGEKGDLPGYFGQPKGIALDSERHVYVVDAHFEAVQVFTAEGTLLMTFGQEGVEAGEFWLPAGIHIDSNDRIWVADSYNRRVQVFDFLAGDERANEVEP